MTDTSDEERIMDFIATCPEGASYFTVTTELGIARTRAVSILEKLHRDGRLSYDCKSKMYFPVARPVIERPPQTDRLAAYERKVEAGLIETPDPEVDRARPDRFPPEETSYPSKVPCRFCKELIALNKLGTHEQLCGKNPNRQGKKCQSGSEEERVPCPIEGCTCMLRKNRKAIYQHLYGYVHRLPPVQVHAYLDKILGTDRPRTSVSKGSSLEERPNKCQYCGKVVEKYLRQHEMFCKENPNAKKAFHNTKREEPAPTTELPQQLPTELPAEGPSNDGTSDAPAAVVMDCTDDIKEGPETASSHESEPPSDPVSSPILGTSNEAPPIKEEHPLENNSGCRINAPSIKEDGETPLPNVQDDRVKCPVDGCEAMLTANRRNVYHHLYRCHPEVPARTASLMADKFREAASDPVDREPEPEEPVVRCQDCVDRDEACVPTSDPPLCWSPKESLVQETRPEHFIPHPERGPLVAEALMRGVHPIDSTNGQDVQVTSTCPGGVLLSCTVTTGVMVDPLAAFAHQHRQRVHREISNLRKVEKKLRRRASSAWTMADRVLAARRTKERELRRFEMELVEVRS